MRLWAAMHDGGPDGGRHAVITRWGLQAPM